MKNRFSRVVFGLIAILVIAASAFSEEAPQFKNVLIVDNESWRTDLAAVAEDGEATVRISDCIGFGTALTARLPLGGGVLVPNVSGLQCSGTRLGVVRLRVLSGRPRLWTQSYYNDADGNRNVVMIPSLPDALPKSYTTPTTGVVAQYVFDGIESSRTTGRSTFLALIPDGEGSTQVELTVAGYGNEANSATETLTVSGFTFYELQTPIEFGRVVVKHVAPPGQSDNEPRLFAVAFVGDRESGSPRVEVPRTRMMVWME